MRVVCLEGRKRNLDLQLASTTIMKNQAPHGFLLLPCSNRTTGMFVIEPARNLWPTCHVAPHTASIPAPYSTTHSCLLSALWAPIGPWVYPAPAVSGPYRQLTSAVIQGSPSPSYAGLGIKLRPLTCWTSTLCSPAQNNREQKSVLAAKNRNHLNKWWEGMPVATQSNSKIYTGMEMVTTSLQV